MKKILVIGAGRSSTSLIKYLLDNSSKENWSVTLVDFDFDLANKKINNHPYGKSSKLDANNTEERRKFISNSDIVISMLPARMHYNVLKDAVELGIHVITPSYVTDEIKLLNDVALKKGVLVLNELGLDPGIDHMSAKKMIDDVELSGGKVTGFESFTGGLVAPDSDDNPWNYKFTWNPRNVVLAGQGVAQYIEKGSLKYISYAKLFERLENIKVLDAGEFEGYANRDSIKYLDIYNLKNIDTLFRGTLRNKGFSSAWNLLVKLGLTDDKTSINQSLNMTYNNFLRSKVFKNKKEDIYQLISSKFNIKKNSLEVQCLDWLELFSNKLIEIKNGTYADILEHILSKKWNMKKNETDRVVMVHRFKYFKNKKLRNLVSYFHIDGKNQIETAMAQTVGLPIGIFIKLFLMNKINLKGIHLPVKEEIYNPILKELKTFGIDFKEVNY